MWLDVQMLRLLMVVQRQWKAERRVHSADKVLNYSLACQLMVLLLSLQLRTSVESSQPACHLDEIAGIKPFAVNMDYTTQ